MARSGWTFKIFKVATPIALSAGMVAMLLVPAGPREAVLNLIADKDLPFPGLSGFSLKFTADPFGTAAMLPLGGIFERQVVPSAEKKPEGRGVLFQYKWPF